MSQFIPISAEHHASLRWRRYSSYEFAQQTHLAALVGAELPKAVMTMPIALVPRPQADSPPETTQGYMFVALLGLEPGVNLYVAPDGRWLGRYVPAALRGHPFRLAQAGNDKLALCVDQDSGLIGEQGDEPFFDQNNEVAEPVKQVMEFLTQIERNRTATLGICDRLQAHGLIQPWPVKLQGGDGGQRTLEGLFRVDEAALNALPAEGLTELRDAGALSLAYCQLLSMQQLSLLGELAQARAAQAPKLDDVFSFPDDDLLHFGD
ncbi:SapC family protein [Thiorhodovibrio frisius]|uniref:SapC n=1 Tax=Thiorhodovibrio frisius TaxID=631362 RepID=H8Z1I7_9GAMM|nr:SapC family protein [Thiorhodovibrio frisius]EIC22536.1 SapC [Thiorhodovibrio frisius]WPL19975.1 SapC [Thiorhodovibrio frisius]